jgi:hypothetical protein
MTSMGEVQERAGAGLERELADSVNRLREICAVLLKDYTREELARMMESVLEPSLDVSPLEGIDSKRYAMEYQKAVEELRRERQEFLGFEDVVRGLMMFVESPEERVRRNLGMDAGD